MPENTSAKKTVFISYARKDAKDFAICLYNDLKTRGVQAWIDQSDMPSGDTFIAEIDRAIDAADYFLLIGTPWATESPYCRDEWLKAIEKAKPIIPLLLVGEYADLPEQAHAKLNDARDFRDSKNYELELERLLDQLQIKPKPAGNLHNVPLLPSYHLTRSTEIDALRDALTAHKTTVLTSIAKRVGVQGMGGVGKSVVTAALARDYFVRRSFSDGIFWLTFGTQPDQKRIEARLRHWLGGSNTPFESVEEAQDFFEKTTRERSALSY